MAKAVVWVVALLVWVYPRYKSASLWIGECTLVVGLLKHAGITTFYILIKYYQLEDKCYLL